MQGLNEVLAGFERLAGVVTRMVALARAQQWQELPALDAQCAALFEQLRAAPLQALDPRQRNRIADLVERIEADQDALTRLVRPQLLRIVRDLRAESRQ